MNPSEKLHQTDFTKYLSVLIFIASENEKKIKFLKYARKYYNENNLNENLRVYTKKNSCAFET